MYSVITFLSTFIFGFFNDEIQDKSACVDFKVEEKCVVPTLPKRPTLPKSVIAMHGAKICVAFQNKDIRTVFRPLASSPLKLARQNYNPEQNGHRKNPSMNDSSTVDKRKRMKLLLVEDCSINRKFLRQLLEMRGHYCEVASNGLIGLNMVKATTSMDTDDLYLRDYDAILMNLSMPVMDGVESTKQILQFGYKGPIIGLTALTLPQDLSVFFDAGAAHIIIKPFRIAALDAIFDLY